MRRLTSIALAAALTTAHLVAQDEAISVRLSPRPNQVIHFSMDQEVSTRIDGVPFEVHGHTHAVLTHTLGERDAAGRLASTMTYDRLSMEMTLNGNAVPAPDFDLAGKAIGLVYDADGALVDLAPPAEMDPTIGAFVKGMLGTLFGSRAADARLRVGETTTLPFAAGLPMPSTAGLPMNLTGETRMKLLGISRVGGERFARLDQSVAASLVTPPAAGTPMTMTATGGGIVEWNLDRGYVTAGETTIEIDADIMQAKMRGRISTTVRGSN
jgi:hypothetical protein